MEITLEHLVPSYIYLTLGTAQQVYALYQGKEVKYEVLWEPTTLELRRRTETATYSWDNKQEVLIVYPKDIVGTGLIKTTKSKSSSRGKKSKDITLEEEVISLSTPSPRRGDTLESGETPLVPKGSYSLPNDQFYQIRPDLTVFIICSSLEGLIPDGVKSQVKKLIGGIYKLLDLQQLESPNLEEVPLELQLEAQRFPLSYQRKLTDLRGDLADLYLQEEIDCLEFNLIKSLTTLEGVRRWHNFSPNEVTRLFMLETLSKPLILLEGRAICLYPYLEPYLRKITRDIHLSSASAYLGEFAYWVYCTSTYWREPYREGLALYIPKSRSFPNKTLPVFSFWITTKAKLEWQKLTARVG